MNLKSKILAAGLAAIIAGGTIFGANCALAQTDNDNTDSAIAQMMQMIETLKQQIQQIIALIAQLKPQETCGNGACRFGETAASCPADCQVNNCIQEGKWGERNQKCCQGLTANHRPAVSSGSIDAQGLFICYKCGDGICSENELQEHCAKDCLPKDNNKCGNGICDSGETITGCAADCSGCQKWTTTKELGGVIVGTPDINPAGNRLIVAGKGADNALWVSEYYPADGRLVAWYSLGGQISGTPTISVPASWNSESKAAIYAIGTDKNMWWRNETSAGVWGEWQTSGSAGQQLTPSKFAGIDNKLYRLTLPGALGASAGAEMKSSVNIERCEQIACSSGLSYYECQAAGGRIYAGYDTVNNCYCPATCNSLSGASCND